MKKWFRWWGIAAFAAVVLLMAAGWLLLVDRIVKKALESAGTKAVGARVEIRKADLSLFPAGLALTGLQVTNPQQPMRNVVEVERIAMTLDAGLLLRRKALVEEMTVDGVRLDTPRKKSGAVKSAKSRQPGKDFDSPSAAGAESDLLDRLMSSGFEIPDVRKVLEKEKLQTLALAESLQADIEAEKRRWQQRLKELPDKEKLESYRNRVDKLKSARRGGLGALLSAPTELVAIQKDIQKDMKRVETALNEFEKQSTVFERKMRQLSNAPQADLQRLKKKYSLTPKGLSNLSALFLQRHLQVWIERAVAWYERLQPLISRPAASKEQPQSSAPLRGKGLNIRFAETNPQPDLLIRSSRVGIEVGGVQLTGIVENITSDPQLVGAPLRFDFGGKGGSDTGAIRLTGLYDAVNPDRKRGNADLQLQNVAIGPSSLFEQPALAARLQSASVDLDLRSSLDQERVNIKLNAGLDPIRIAIEERNNTDRFAQALAGALAGVRRMKISAAVDGTLERQQIDVKTDLDRILKDAVTNLARKEAAKLNQALQKEISKKTKVPIDQTGLQLDQFGLIGNELSGRLNLGDDMLKGLL